MEWNLVDLLKGYRQIPFQKKNLKKTTHKELKAVLVEISVRCSG